MRALTRNAGYVLFGVLIAVGIASANGDAAPGRKVAKSTEMQAGMKAYRKGQFDQAFKLLAPVAEKGDRAAQYYVGHMYEKGEGRPVDTERAIKWYRRSAEAGYARAQFKLAAGYADGYGSVEKDHGKAREWLLKSAEGGYRRAQRILAGAYERGEIGFPRDPQKADYWTQQAAR
jgi:uncharacterized protein